MIITSCFTLAMKHQGHRAGCASALLGLLPLLLGFMVSPLVGINEETAVPMGAILFITSCIGSAAFFKLTKKEEQTEPSVRLKVGGNGLPFYFGFFNMLDIRCTV
ncbi:hypothetical protein J2S09_005048 [Bacillus fengqiuensis]|nr:hypothetical protein [Bacillus fengqiuensis]